MKLNRKDTLAIVIDVQDKFLPHIYESQQLMLNISRFIKGLEILKIPILLTEQNPDKLGKTCEPVQQVLPDYQPLSKMCFSCMDNESFKEKLLQTGKKQIILIGIETHICILQTAMDLLKENFSVYIAEDCVSSRTIKNNDNGIARIRQHGGIISCTESMLFEICGISGTDEFRKISSLVK